MIRRPPRSTQSRSSAASDVYKRQLADDRTPEDPGEEVVAGPSGGQARPRTGAASRYWSSTAEPASYSGLTRSATCSVPDLSLIHISEPTRRTPISYAVFCLKKKK